MTVRLRPMTDAERAAWLPGSTERFVAERTRSGDDPGQARARAQQLVDVYFPDGRPGPRHELFVFEDDGERVGTAWVGPAAHREADPAAAWLYDIEIDEGRRGRGHGRAAMALLQQHLSRGGVSELGLNVSGGDVTARHLYSRAGFRETAVVMTKRLVPPRD